MTMPTGNWENPPVYGQWTIEDSQNWLFAKEDKNSISMDFQVCQPQKFTTTLKVTVSYYIYSAITIHRWALQLLPFVRVLTVTHCTPLPLWVFVASINTKTERGMQSVCPWSSVLSGVAPILAGTLLFVRYTAHKLKGIMGWWTLTGI